MRTLKPTLSSRFVRRPIPGEGTLKAVVTIGGQSFSFSRERIAYPHIGVHILMPPAEAKLVRADIRTNGHLIGYIPGAGDDIPAALQQIGYTVKQLGEGDLRLENLRQFSAIVLGVRIFNTQDRIATWLPALVEYAKSGGVVVDPIQHHGGSEIDRVRALSAPAFARSRDR